MPQTCTVCKHKDRAAIDAAIINKTPSRAIANQFQVNRSPVARHAEKCIPDAIAAAQVVIGVRTVRPWKTV